MDNTGREMSPHELAGEGRWSRAITLDPYDKKVSMLTDKGAIVCTYQEAVDNPNISGYLLPSTIALIHHNLEYEKQAGDR